VFISYRRSDAYGWPGRIHDALAARLPSCEVFRDIDDIPLGADFTEVLDHALRDCDVLLALIGPQWLSATDATGRRLDSPNDYLRLELESALDRGVLLIPILLEGARMPEAGELPESLTSISRSQALQLSDAHFNIDVAKLCARLRGLAEGFGRGAPRARHDDAGAAVTQEVPITQEHEGRPLAETVTVRADAHHHDRTSGRRRRPRRRAVVAAAVVVAVALAIGATVALQGGSSRNVAAPVANRGVLRFASLALGTGMQLDRSWRLTGRQGDALAAELTVTNPTGTTRSDTYEEVIPKEVAANVSSITFAAPVPEIVKADPVVKYTFSVPAGKTQTVRYTVRVAAAGTGDARLGSLKAAWAKAYDDRTKERDAIARLVAAAGTPPTSAVGAPAPSTPGRSSRSAGTGGVPVAAKPSPPTVATTQARPSTSSSTDWPAPSATGGSFTVTIGANGWSDSPYYGWRLPVGQGDTAPGGHGLSLVNVGPASYGTASALNYLCGSQNSLCAFYHTCFNGTYDATFPYTIRDVVTNKTATATITVHVQISNTLPPTVC
jgi:hypothetical protein